MKFGVHTFIWTASLDRHVFSLLPLLKQHGFDGVEVPIFGPDEFPASDIRKGVEENGLECTISSVIPGGLSVISEDAGVRRSTLAHMRDCIEVAAEAGSKIMVGPLYSPVGYLPGRRRTASEWEHAVECYQSLGPFLKEFGIQMAIEPLNRFETFFLNTAADAAALCDQVNDPNIGILFDTFHANIEEKSIGAACRAAGRHLKHVHTCENDRGIPGSGHVEWQELFQSLRERNYDGWLTIESFGFAIGELSAAASVWRDLAPSPESIAFEGVKFLRRNIELTAAQK